MIAARDATLLVSNMDGGVERVLNGATGTINRLQVGRLGDVLAVTSEGNATIWPAGRSEPIGLEKAGTVLAASFNRDGTQVLTGSEEKFARIWSRTGQVLFGPVMHDKRVNAVAFSPDGSFFAIASSDNTATLWSARGVPYEVLSAHSGYQRRGHQSRQWTGGHGTGSPRCAAIPTSSGPWPSARMDASS